jgi:hypothetical protein
MPRRRLPNLPQHQQMIVMRPMRKVQPTNVNASLKQRQQRLNVRHSGPHGGDDLSADGSH